MNRLSQTFKVFLAFLFAVLSTNLLPVYASALTAPDADTIIDKVSFCHAKPADTAANGWDLLDTATEVVFNSGHDSEHDADIIPPFKYKEPGRNGEVKIFTGKNWTAEGMAVYANDCKTETVAEPETPAAPKVNAITKCGTYGSVVLPKDTDTISYSVTPANPSEGTFTVTASPAKDVTLDVTGTGYTLGQNGKATFSGDLGVYATCTQPPTLVECESFQRIEATNKDLNGWTLGDNASFVHGGIKLDVTGDWDTTTITRSLTGELRDLGTGVDFTPNEDYLGLHVKTSKGTLTYEKYYENQDPANAGKWWSESDFGVSSGQGYATFDTLENIVAANPDVTLENLRVLYTNPNPASVVVNSVKIGCNEYTFDYVRMEQACTVRDNTYRDSWQYDGASFPEATDYDGTVNNATYKFTPEGLHISTPDTDSYVFGLIDGGKTALADIDTMSYMTYRKAMSAGYAQTHPAYVLYVDTNGDVAGGETYFVYEPYNNSPNAALEDTWQTWDAIDNGDAQWWMSGTGQKLQSWSYFVREYPEAVVLAYGFNQGTSNAETYSIVQDVTFDCATTHFDAPQVLGDSTSTTTTTTPVTSVVTPSAAVLPVQIPATGSQNGQQIGLLAAIILGSLTYFVVLRRKQEFEI